MPLSISNPIDTDKLIRYAKIGEGSYFEVYCGKYVNQDVAIKCLKANAKEEIKYLMNEF